MNYVATFDFSRIGDRAGSDAAVDLHPHDDGLADGTVPAIVVPDAYLLFTGDYKRSGIDLVLSRDGHDHVVHDYFKGHTRATLASPDGAHLSGDLVNALTGEVQVAQAAGAPGAAAIIGRVTKLTGSATAIRNGVSIQLNVGDNVNKGDVVQAGGDSSLGLTFIDGTVFGLSANARMVLNEMVYDPNGTSNSSLLSLVQGTITFVAGETAKHGDMKVDTPVATMGIRGTAVLVEIDFTVPGQTSDATPVKFQVLVEPDGRTGSYVLYSKSDPNLVIGTVNQAGQVTSVTGTGDTSTALAPLTPIAQAIIQQTLQQYFPGYVPAAVPQTLNPNPQSTSPNGGSPPAFPTPGSSDPEFPHPTTPPSPIPLNQPTTVPINLNTGTDTPPTTVQVTVTRFNSAPTIVVTPVVDNNSFDIARQVAITDPDSSDIAVPYVTGTGKILGITGPAHIPAGVDLGRLVTVDPATGHVSYDPARFAFLAQGESVVVTVGFDSQSGPDTVHETLTVTIDGVNAAPVVAAPLNVSIIQGATALTANLLAGATDPNDAETATLSVSNVTYKVANGATSSTAPAGVSLTGTTLSVDPADPAFRHLAFGQTETIVVSYNVTDIHGAIVTQTETITITGINDAPVVAAPLTTGGIEGATLFTTNLLAGATDPDDGETATLAVTDVHYTVGNGTVSSTAPAGVSLIGTTLSVDPANAAFNHLALGQTATIVVSYNVTDVHGATVAQTETITVTGTNDAPVVAAPLIATADAGDSAFTANLLAGASDPDDGETATLSVTNVHYTIDNGTASVTAPAGVTLTGTTLGIDPANAAFAQLTAGQTTTVVVSYNVTDVHGATVAQTETLTVTGITSANDAPVVTSGTNATGSISIAILAAAATGLTTSAATILNAGAGLIGGLPGGGSGFGTLALAAGDDNSSGAINITSVFGTSGIDFFGHNYTSLYINNNGNITFGSPSGTYTPSVINAGFDNPIIAPFWGDVDTRGAGAVYYTLDPVDGVMTITWDQVGYYSFGTDRLDSFQVVLVNEGSGNFDIQYRYQDINWTTGSASGGVDGLGGTVARAGYSAGDGVHYFELPQSGNQTALLALATTPGNTGVAGVDGFEVHNGAVVSSAVTTTGVINFADANLNDVHTASVTAPDNIVGSLTVTLLHDTTGSSTGGQFSWSYNADATDVQTALLHSADGTAIETFNVTISDGHGGTVEQDVSVTLTASNANVWSGHSSNVDLSNATGWSLGHIPTTTEVVYIDTASQFSLQLAGQTETIGGLHLVAGAEIDLTGATTSPAAVTVAGPLINNGIMMVGQNATLQVDGATENTGSITAHDGTIRFDGAVTGHGQDIINGGIIEFAGPSDANVQLTAAAQDTLVLDDAADFTGTVSGLSVAADGDTIRLGGLSPSSAHAQSDPGVLEFDFSAGNVSALIVANYASGSTTTHTLTATTGNDVMIGGAGVDNFVFASNFGHDTITNFQQGADHIDLSAIVATTDINSWIANHVAASPTNSADTLITIDPNDTITLHNVAASSLHASDFIIHAVALA